MDFTHTEDRRMLADTFGRYLADRYAIAERHRVAATDEGWSADKWREMAELGIVGALLPEAAGGFGGTGFDLAAAFEQIGRRLVVEPFLAAAMAGRVLSAAGGHEALLGAAIAGKAVLGFAHEEPGSRYDLDAVSTAARRDGDRWRLTGGKVVAPGLAAASHVVVSARDGDDVALFLIESAGEGVNVRDYPLIDGGHAGDLALDGAAAERIAGADALDDAIAVGIVALVWEAVGAMDEIRAATLDYLRTRKQFGVPIGKFQALQHRMATVALEIEQARSAAINAAAALDGEAWARARAASAAKFTIGRVGTLVAEEAIQLHGGIGMTWELPLPHYAKRLVMIGHQLGDEDWHLERYVALGRADTASIGAPSGAHPG